MVAEAAASAGLRRPAALAARHLPVAQAVAPRAAGVGCACGGGCTTRGWACGCACGGGPGGLGGGVTFPAGGGVGDGLTCGRGPPGGCGGALAGGATVVPCAQGQT